jgi:uncharacterized protein YcnI
MIRTLSRIAVVATAVMILPLAAAPAAQAHVTANPDEATSPYFRTTLRVGHGCDGEPTHTVRVQIPEGVSNAKPEVTPGWETDIVREDLDEPIEGDEETITDRVAEIVWEGGPLPDDHFQEFGLSLRIADDAPDVLWLPTIQECEEGEHRWVEIPDSVEQWGDLDEPAPYVQVAMGGGEDEAEEEAAACDEEEPAAAADDESGAAATPWAIAGLVAGLLGLGAGATALARTRNA